jgi:FG-GAP repeat protein
MWHRAVGVMVVCWLGTACNQLLGIPDVTQGRVVRGRVHGLWDGADGVALRLMANGVDALLTASNGEFHFPPQFAPGTSYTVTVLTNPVQHTCIVDGGGNGVVPDTDVMSVSIACTGPAMTVGFSGPWAWTFDPTEETQTFSGSVIAREVALTIGGPRITSATVNGTAVPLGQPSATIALPLGPTTARVGVTASGGLSKTYELVFQRGAAIIDQLTYGKASNTGMNDTFGFSMSLSGNTLAVGAAGEASATTDPGNNVAPDAGAVYVFVRTGASWIQQAYLKASNADMNDGFGTSVSLSGDTLAVGAPGEASATTDPTDNTASGAGAVYVFIRKDGSWSQQAYVKASNPGAKDQFGQSVSLSQDTLAVGAPREDSVTASDPNDNTALDAGAVYVFVRTGAAWNPQGYLKASNVESGDQFGASVSVSGDSLAVGAVNEASGTGSPTDNSAPRAGAVYVFTRASRIWTEQAYLKASNASMGYLFGWSVALSQNTLAVGSISESSAATGVNGNQNDHSAPGSGAAYVFVRDGTTWTEQAYLKASNTGPGDTFGFSVAVSGEILAVSAIAEASNTTGTNGNQADNSAIGAGAVYVYLRTGTTWTQQAYLKASNTGMSDNFGGSIALSPDTLVIAAPTEASGSTGFTGNPADNSTPRSGAFYAFR